MLRVGLLIDSLVQPAWTYQILSEIARSDFARIELVIQNGAAAPRRGLIARLRGVQTQHLLYNAYGRLDRLVSERIGPGATAFAPRDVAGLLCGCPRLIVRPIQGRFTDEFPEPDLRRIRAYGLDVLLRFGFRILKGGILHASRHGVWSYHHGDNRRYRGGPAGFWEVMKGDDATGCVLQVLSEELDNGRILQRASCRTIKASVRQNQDNLFWRSAGMMVGKLRELHRHGQVAEEAPAPLPAYDQRLYTVPKNGEMALLLLSLAGRGARHLLTRLIYKEEWRLAYRLGSDLPQSFYRYQPIPSGRNDAFWADPFVVRGADGRYHIFFEEFEYKRRKGRIAVMEMDEKGRTGPPRVALERPYHLSYPFLFTFNGDHYLMPETAGNRTIELYRCLRFPDEWTLDRVLLREVDAADPTLYEQDGTFYLFFAGRPPGARDYDDLYLYTADSPLGPFSPSPGNPIKSDVHSARPAGGLLRIGGRLYRPAQDGAARYGHAITLSEVTALSPDGFAEREVAKIRPDWRRDLVGVHTLQQGPGISVIDMLCRVPRLSL